jgi:hypothetical protein
MELKGVGFLYTLATLMVTFAGFSALLLIIRQSAGARLSALDRFLTRTVVGHLFVLTAGALLPALLDLYGIPDAAVWMASAVIFGLPYLALLLTFPRRRIAVTGKPPPPLVLATFIWLGAASLIAMFVYVFGNFPHKAAAYITALTVNFFTLALSFVIALEVILGQPNEVAPNAKE